MDCDFDGALGMGTVGLDKHKPVLYNMNAAGNRPCRVACYIAVALVVAANTRSLFNPHRGHT